jgi:hypothetical protein
MWSALIGPIANLISKPIERYQEERLVKVESKAEVIRAKSQRQATEQTNARAWEENVLIKSGVYLRWFCALHLFAGMDYTIYAALTGRDATTLWTALDMMPDWYAGLLATMFGFAFGSSGIKKAGSVLVAKWRKPVTKQTKDT